MFLDDDVVPDPGTLESHLDWHSRYPDESVGVLGDVRWASELTVTPFMRWLERGIQFDYRGIVGDEAGWGRFYTANVSVKRSLLEKVGGFDEGLPWGYEDLDIAMRMHEAHGFRLLYNREATAQHLHEMTLESWRKRAATVARAERLFVARHPEFPPYFFDLFSAAAAQPRARGRGAKLARWVPEGVPWLGPRVWGAADLHWRQELAEPFLAAWNEAAE
jgi:GT2 family glycosyltransferase